MGEVKVESHNMGPTLSRLTSLSFHVNLASRSWVMTFSKFDLENQRSRSWVRYYSKSQCGLTSYRLTSLLFRGNRPSHSWVIFFFKIRPWNSKVKVMGEVTVQSHNVGLTSYQLTSLLFHVNRPSHSWNTAFSKFDLENQVSRSNDPDVAKLQVQTIP